MKCKECASEIPVGASKCKECNAFQDWRRYLTISSTTLSLLVALFSVLTVAVPVVVEAVSTDTSEATVEVMPYKGGREILLLVRNKGSRPAFFRSFEILSDNEATEIASQQIGDSIAPGEFTIRPIFLDDDLPASKCSIRVMIHQFSGAVSEFKHRL